MASREIGGYSHSPSTFRPLLIFLLSIPSQATALAAELATTVCIPYRGCGAGRGVKHNKASQPTSTNKPANILID
ncbi:hypothetical protein LI328DRAFT_3689 [Trichoderma asperelloides]|nr:hypothetical protein LI328DRAFT_3689 [Trichoderma asperelloides]